MENQDELDRIVCPESGERLVPERVWESKDPKSKQIHRYGVMKKHHHNSQECDYSGHVEKVVRDDSQQEKYLGLSTLYF